MQWRSSASSDDFLESIKLSLKKFNKNFEI